LGPFNLLMFVFGASKHKYIVNVAKSVAVDEVL